MQKSNVLSIDTYISNFQKEIQVMLQAVRKIIHDAAPDAEETIKYGIPTFTLHGNLVHFGAYKHHIGFYPTPSAMTAFKKELSVYKTSKGAVQLPLDVPLPIALIAKIVKFRVKENVKNS
jgi:uncharacterized protein YdhG (YjbR/CyaY superfamily)